MDNENLVLKVKHENWALLAPGNWQHTIWKIYGDLKMEVAVSNGYETKKKEIKISQKNYDLIMELLRQSEKEDKKVEALDGSGWEIKRYQGKTKVWERKMAYIYGIRSLESLSRLLYKLAEIKKLDI